MDQDVVAPEARSHVEVSTAENGYPEMLVDGIPLLDRGWLSREL